MISNSVKQLFKRQSGLIQTQARSMGGGPKKPNMPATETNFDVVVVGKLNFRNQSSCFDHLIFFI